MLTTSVPFCFQVHTLEVYQKGLNDSEDLVFQAVQGLHRALQGDYRDAVNMRESSKQRLEALREAAIKVKGWMEHECCIRVLVDRGLIHIQSLSLLFKVWSTIISPSITTFIILPSSWPDDITDHFYTTFLGISTKFQHITDKYHTRLRQLVFWVLSPSRRSRSMWSCWP